MACFCPGAKSFKKGRAMRRRYGSGLGVAFAPTGTDPDAGEGAAEGAAEGAGAGAGDDADAERTLRLTAKAKSQRPKNEQ